MRRLMVVVLLLTVVQSVSAASSRPALRPVVNGLERPVGVVSPPGDPRLFIVDQNGFIVIVENGQLRSQPFLNISTVISCCGEMGLLGLAFHPNFAQNGFFYVDYVDLHGYTIISRYKVDAFDRNRADVTSEKPLLAILQPYSNHNGGQLQFGPDGYLYIGMGDGGSAGDPQNRAQNLGELLGKILRIDVDHGSPYAIPPDNPFVSTPGARGETWAYGLRNPWRFNFDRETKDLWIGDVGQSAWEEIDFQPATSHGGENYGWRRMEGSHCYNPASGCDTGNLTMPVAEYSHSFGCSVTGGYRYRGKLNPRFRGLYFYGDYCSGTIWTLAPSVSGGWTSSVFLNSGLDIVSFGEDAEGELYVVDGRGAVYRIVDEEPVRRHGVRR